jgi:succinate dehydrogenase / fumarate reductase cytochrome b subunit
MAGESSERRARPRPLSPHLQIYRPLINMVMSILHRITGAALYVGTVLLAAWLISAATSPECFATINGLFASWPGMIVLVGYSWALIHHALGGMRHFIWDTGAGLDIGAVDLLSWSTIVLSVLLTAVLWFYIGMQRGWVTAWQ